MKKLLIGIFFLGLTNLAFAQASAEEGSVLELEGITVLASNMAYFNTVLSSTVKALEVVNLQKAAASHDITKTSIYDPKERYHDFSFKQQDGNLLATFDRDGSIVKTYERYKNIAIPLPVRQSLYKAFPGWYAEANMYIVSYNRGRGAREKFKVKLSKDGKTKRVKMDDQGKIL